MRCWRDLRGLRDPDRFEAWLHRLLVNACRDLARRGRRRPQETFGDPVDTPATADDYRQLADHDELERAFTALPADQRIALVLTHYVGYTAPELAKILDVPTGTVYSLTRPRHPGHARGARRILCPPPQPRSQCDDAARRRPNSPPGWPMVLRTRQPPAWNGPWSITRAARQRPAWLATALNGGAIGADRTASTMQPISIVVGTRPSPCCSAGCWSVAGCVHHRRHLSCLPLAPLRPSRRRSHLCPRLHSRLVAYSVVTQLEPGEGSCSRPSSRPCATRHGSGSRIRMDRTRASCCPPSRASRGRFRLPGRRMGLYCSTTLITRAAPPAWSCRSTHLRSAAARGHLRGRHLLRGGHVTFSPDGTQPAFVRSDVDDASVIAIMDLASGTTIELDSTRITNAEPRGACEEHCDGIIDDPQWAPDCTRLVFALQGVFNAETGEYETILLMVNADGSDLHQVVPAELVRDHPELVPGRRVDRLHLVERDCRRPRHGHRVTRPLPRATGWDRHPTPDVGRHFRPPELDERRSDCLRPLPQAWTPASRPASSCG